MRLTQEADYALRIVQVLAREGRVLDARSISEAASVTERFTVKILRKLTMGGIIGSKKGAMGGYELAASPEKITICAVVETIEGPLEISRCLDGGYECSRNGGDKACCTFHRIFASLNRKIREKLEAITIAEIIDDGVSTEQILSKIN